MHNVPRPAAACPEPFDAIPRSVQSRADLTYGAKCLYGALRTYQNMRRQPTYAELAEHLAASVRSVVRWVARLAEVGLIAVRRRGQGLPNVVTVVGLVTSGGDRAPAPVVTGWQSPTRARHWETKKNEGRRPEPLSEGRCMGCKGDHALPRCPRYAYVIRT
jgi:hypothetical protein